MIYGILGDIHGNIEALDAVLEELGKAGAQHYISVGDIVGYGADPVACIERIQGLKATVVAGNHDWAAVSKLDTSFFNIYAKAAVDWTSSQLGPSHKAWLAALPLNVVVHGEVSVAHSTLDAPEQFDYIQTYYDAARTINAMTTKVCFVGHSHVPLAFVLKDHLVLKVDTTLDLRTASRALINVGSIGQPRDENPKAAFGLYDSESQIYQIRRVRYDIRTACAKIKDAGLPQILADRLKFGR